MRRRKRAALLGLTMVMILSGCTQPNPETTPTPAPAPTPAVAAEKKPFALACYPAGGFHPLRSSNRINLSLFPLLYQGLFSVDGQFRAKEELCQSYTVSEDGLVWTFLLRPALFSDGSPLTGAEAAASLEQARRSSRYEGRLKDVTKVTGSEDSVTVTLRRPNAALPVLLDVPVFKETEDPQRPLGTGRYYLAGEGESLALAARDGWEAPVDPIGLRSVASGDELVYAFDAQEVALVDADLTGTNALGYSGRFETTDYPTTTLLYVGCNTRSGACRELGVRQALLRSFDREEIARRLLDRRAVASALPIHPWAEGYDRELADTLKYDPAAAEEMLELAGWEKDEEGRLRRGRSTLALRLVVNQDNIYKVTVAEALAEDLRGIGCDVTLAKLPWEEFTAALSRGEFDLYLGETTLTADFDPEALLGAGGALNYGGFSDRELEELMERYRSAGEETRAMAASELWTRAAEMAPILPLCFKNGSVLTQWGQMGNVTPTQRDVFAGMENWRVKGYS